MESTPPSAEQRLAEALRRTLDALPTASPQQRAFLYKRAGDVCVGLEERRKALGWYGRAVDQYLQLGDAEQAALLCRLIIHVQPEAVRARCTLTWIAIGRGEDAEAARQLDGYVQAALRAGQTTLAAQQVEWMFGTAGSRLVRERVAAALHVLGEDARADVLAARVAEPSPAGAEERWARLLAATTGAPAAASPPGE